MTDHDKGSDATKHHGKDTEDSKKRLAEENTARTKKQAEQRSAMEGAKPTPTQEENDLTASGQHLTEHEPDGSPADPNITPPPPVEPPPEGGAAQASREAKAAAHNQRSDYSTRAAAPAKHE